MKSTKVQTLGAYEAVAHVLAMGQFHRSHDHGESRGVPRVPCNPPFARVTTKVFLIFVFTEWL